MYGMASLLLQSVDDWISHAAKWAPASSAFSRFMALAYIAPPCPFAIVIRVHPLPFPFADIRNKKSMQGRNKQRKPVIIIIVVVVI